MKLTKPYLFFGICLIVISLIAFYFARNVKEKNIIKLRIVENQWKFSPDKITIYSNQDWKLVIYNEDNYPHSIYIKELKINQTLPSKAETTILINSPLKGTFNFFCSTVCGEGHYRMTGQIEIK